MPSQGAGSAARSISRALLYLSAAPPVRTDRAGRYTVRAIARTSRGRRPFHPARGASCSGNFYKMASRPASPLLMATRRYRRGRPSDMDKRSSRRCFPCSAPARLAPPFFSPSLLACIRAHRVSFSWGSARLDGTALDDKCHNYWPFTGRRVGEHRCR